MKPLHHVLSNIGHEFPTIERTTRGDVEVVTLWVRADDEVLVRGDEIPGDMRSAKGAFWASSRDNEANIPAHSVGVRLNALLLFAIRVLHDDAQFLL
jgi:hypothetical protein